MLPSKNANLPPQSTAPGDYQGALTETESMQSSLHSKTKVSASVDASAIRYRAQTTPDYSPRTSPRAAAQEATQRQPRAAGSTRRVPRR